MAGLTPRRRNTVLIFGCGLAILLLPLLQPKVPPPAFEWSWEDFGAAPTDGVPSVAADQHAAIRILPSPQSAWVAEMLFAVGLLDVRVGPPATHDAAVVEVWVLPAGDCSNAAAAVAHHDAGGPLVGWARCPYLADPADEPTRRWSDEAAIALVERDGRTQLRDLALPSTGRAWADSSAPFAVRRVGGGVVGEATAGRAWFSFDLAGWTRRLRQGESELAGIDADGDGVTRPDDLRPFGWASPTWRLPSADLWAEVLATSIEIAAGRPLDRLWPIPEGAATAIILTVEPAAGSSPEAATELVEALRQGGEEATDLRRVAKLSGLRAPQEMAAAVHTAAASDPTDPPVALRFDEPAWWGYDAPVTLLAEEGIDLDLTFESAPGRFGGPGYRFGSARAMRYSPTPDRLLPVLSIPTAVMNGTPEAATDRYRLATRRLVRSAMTLRVPVTARIRADEDSDVAPVVLAELLDEARAAGLPVVSAERYAVWSWDRLERLAGRPGHSGIPQWRWSPGGCPDLPASPFSGPGCLQELGRR